MFEVKINEFFTEYNKYLESQKWKDLRLQVLRRDKFKCKYCKSKKAEHVHHLSYQNYKLHGHSTIDECVSVCAPCHYLLHSGRVNDILKYDIKDAFNPYEINGLSKSENGLMMCPACHDTRIRECAMYFLDGKDGYEFLEEDAKYTVVPFHCENGHGLCFLITSKNGNITTQIIGNEGTTFAPLDWIAVFKGVIATDLAQMSVAY